MNTEEPEIGQGHDIPTHDPVPAEPPKPANPEPTQAPVDPEKGWVVTPAPVKPEHPGQ